VSGACQHLQTHPGVAVLHVPHLCARWVGGSVGG
jgi:hypothetical protein